jgi:hypothetical protein
MSDMKKEDNGYNSKISISVRQLKPHGEGRFSERWKGWEMTCGC